MLRTLTALGVAFALAGAAHAEQISVRIDGRSPQAVREDIYKAAHQICHDDRSVIDPLFEDQTCIEKTAQAALVQVNYLKLAPTTSASIR